MISEVQKEYLCHRVGSKEGMRGCACARFNSASYRIFHVIFRAVTQRGRRSRVHEATYFRVRLHRTIGYYGLKLYMDQRLIVAKKGRRRLRRRSNKISILRTSSRCSPFEKIAEDCSVFQTSSRSSSSFLVPLFLCMKRMSNREVQFCDVLIRVPLRI